MELRYGKVEIKHPENIHRDYPSSLALYCIYAVELPQSVPVNEPATEWRLLTAHQVEDTAYAMQCIEWYKLR
jgi:hypothetical protein